MAIDFDTYAPFDGGAGANVTEDTWRKMMRNAGTEFSGVLRGQDNALAVTGDSTGMQVKVATGQVWIEGHWGEVTAQKTLPLTAAHPTLDRFDLVVARLDGTNNVIELAVVTGTAAASPTVPVPSQVSSATYEVPLAYVDVQSGVTTITAGNVVDYRQYTTAYARYSSNTTQSLATGTDLLLVDFNTDDTTCYDVQINSGDDTFTLKRAGWWRVEAAVKWATGTTGYRRLYVGSGATFATRYVETTTSASPDNISQHVSVSRWLAADATVSVGAQHTQGASLNLVGSGGLTWVTFTWEGN